MEIAGTPVAAIGPGLLVLVGVERDDDSHCAARLAERLLAYRVFADSEGRMNRSVADLGGELLLVPQFTLAADTTRGTRAGFSTAAEPAKGQALFDELVRACRERGTSVATGQFGAQMQVTLTNDGPVTFWLRAAPRAASV